MYYIKGIDKATSRYVYYIWFSKADTNYLTTLNKHTLVLDNVRLGVRVNQIVKKKKKRKLYAAYLATAPEKRFFEVQA